MDSHSLPPPPPPPPRLSVAEPLSPRLRSPSGDQTLNQPLFPISNIIDYMNLNKQKEEATSTTTSTTAAKTDVKVESTTMTSSDHNGRKDDNEASLKNIGSAMPFLLQDQDCNLSKHVKLPMIAVVGDTSSGKSSLLTSLTGIPLPAASSLTTKCPIQLQLEPAPLQEGQNTNRQPTRATVRIQWRTSTNGSSISSNGSLDGGSPARLQNGSPRERKRALEQNRPPPIFEPRVVTTRTESDQNDDRKQANDDDWDDRLIQVIQEAQDTILRFRHNHRVAPDIISVHVQGPDITHPITLVDLPGLVQFQPTKATPSLSLPADLGSSDSYEDSYRRQEKMDDDDSVSATVEEKKYDETNGSYNFHLQSSNGDNGQNNLLIEEVQAVMRDYFANERCLLLAVLSSAVDIHNSKVLSMTQAVDPYTTRTIPVLTKPDLIDAGAEGDVVQLLLSSPSKSIGRGRQRSKGSRSMFRHGFFLVKNRGQAQLDQKVSLEQGLSDEVDYFATTEPWASLPNNVRETRLGVGNLLQKLAQLQWSMTRAALPQVIQDIQIQRSTCKEILDGMGTLYTTRTERRRFYQSILQDLWVQLHACLSGKGLRGAGSSESSRGRRRRQGGRFGVQQTEDKPPAELSHGQSTIGNQNSQKSTNPPQGTRQPLAAAQLHHACADFCQEIRSGSLATIQSLVEGAHVLVSSPDTVGGDDVRGEIVHIDEVRGFACVDCLSPKDRTTDVLFDAIGYSAGRDGTIVSTTSNATTVHHHNRDGVDVIHHGRTSMLDHAHDPEEDEDRLQEDEVWSDGQHVYISREYPLVDRLRPIPLKRIRTDPSWLLEKIAQYRTDDLACFINVDIFKHIVAEFVQQDWAPPCQLLVETTRRIVMTTLDECLQETLRLHGIVKDDYPDEVPSCRFPLLRLALHDTCHQVAEELLTAAKQELEAHLELEESHPYTQDDVLLDTIAQSRYETLKRDLELQLRLDQEGVVLDTHAIQTILDRVFEKHRSPKSSSTTTSSSSSPSSIPHLSTASGATFMAEELELILSCYGKVATQRVLDRTPMICWQVCRSLKPKLEQALGCFADETLTEYLSEAPEALAHVEAMTEKLQELDLAMGRIQKLLHQR